MQKKQATGIDTRMMIPVYAGAFAIICQLFLPWISIPALRYSRLPTTYTLFRMNECLDNVQTCVATGGKLVMEPLTAGEMSTLSTVTLVMQAAAIILIVFMAAAMAAVFIKREKSIGIVKISSAFHFLYAVALFGVLLWANIAVNGKMGRENSFINLSVSSNLQLTSWVYGQMLVSLGVFLSAGKLMNVSRDAEVQKYVERTMKEDKKMGKRTKVTLLLIVVAIPLVIFFGIFFLNDRSNVFIGMCIICLAMLPFGMVFEDRKPQARELLLIAVISSIAVVGRVAFFAVPQFKPVTAIVIIAGVALGAEAGFLTGTVSGFVSNFFFGQGPWTPWQMFAYGIIGFIAGLLFNKLLAKQKVKDKRWERRHIAAVCIYGGIATVLIYGLVMDFSSALNFTQEFSWAVLVAKMASGIYFNLIHAAATVIFLFYLARPMEKKLERIKKKYGLLQV